MRQPGYFAQYHGMVHRVPFVGAGEWVAITSPVEPDEIATAYPDALEIGVGRDDVPWLKLPRSSLERYFIVRVDATWHGEPVWIQGVGENGLVGIGYLGSSEFGRKHGLVGQEREGYFGEVPEVELRDIKVTEKDLL